MLLVASVLATSSPCTPAQIAAAAIVSPAKEEAPADVGLLRVNAGFWRPSVQEIAFRGRCAAKVVGMRGGRTLDTVNGLTLSTEGGSRLDVRDDAWPAADPEPPHPRWKGHRFSGSAPLAFGTWRVGAWVRPDGATDIARYRPQDGSPPIILMTSEKPVLGVSYLPLPDAVGGSLLFAQRLGPSHFRMVDMGWSEAGLRAPIGNGSRRRR